MEKYYFVYIVTNKKRGVLYTGVTGNMIKRIYEHKTNVFEGFSSKYNCKKLVYFETFDDVNEAIKREKQIKAWKREWKIKQIEIENKHWKDLYEDL